MLAPLVFLLGHGLAQTTNGSTSSSDDATAKQWSFSLSTFGYLVPHDQSYASPVFRADHEWLHLEARYNYEAQETGSIWAGYNLSAGHQLVFEATPMLGAVFGNTTGVAPDCELALSYKKVQLSAEVEYVYDPSDSKSSFLYSWNELVYSPTDWFHAGLVSQRTRAYHTPLDVQRGFSVGFSHRNLDFTTYVFNAGWTDPIVVLALGFTF
jgi:hypothetical protein